ncbi:MAG: hypothetical protein IKI29_06790 [Clostridia bacterium]|nr:hypothetical protein [Clostridia bacterium]
MRKPYRLFWRTFWLSSVIVWCLLLGGYGVAKAYENTVRIGYGEYRSAIRLTSDGLQILDFLIPL